MAVQYFGTVFIDGQSTFAEPRADQWERLGVRSVLELGSGKSARWSSALGLSAAAPDRLVAADLSPPICTCAECMEGEMKHCNTVTMGLNGMPSSIQLLLRKRVDLIVQVTLRSRAHKDRPTPASKASGKSSTRVLGWHLNLQTCPGRDILNTKVCT